MPTLHFPDGVIMPTISGEKDKLDFPTLALHAGITIFGVVAWMTGDWAGDYKRLSPPGFSLHRGLGICLALFILARLLYGVLAPEQVRWGRLIPLDFRAWLAPLGEELPSPLTLQLSD